MGEKMNSPFFFMREVTPESLTDVLNKKIKELKILNEKLQIEKEENKKLTRQIQLSEQKFRRLHETSPAVEPL